MTTSLHFGDDDVGTRRRSAINCDRLSLDFSAAPRALYLVDTRLKIADHFIEFGGDEPILRRRVIPRESPIKIGTLAKLSNLFIDFGHLQGRVSRGAMVALRKIDLGRSVVQGRVPAPPPLARSGVIGPGARSIASGAFAAAPPVALGGNELPLETACSLPSHAARKSPRARAPRLT